MNFNDIQILISWCILTHFCLFWLKVIVYIVTNIDIIIMQENPKKVCPHISHISKKIVESLTLKKSITCETGDKSLKQASE